MSERDDNYWKNAYSQTWEESAEKENLFKRLIEAETGCALLKKGLGAGSTDFIDGSAAKNGKEKGESDFQVEGTNIAIEVTGPLKKNVSSDAPLWFRPDKVEYASRTTSEDTFLVHYCPAAKLWRFVHVDQLFLGAYQNNKFERIKPRIRGRYENYIEIPATDECVRPIEELYQYVSRRLNEKDGQLIQGEMSPAHNALEFLKEQKSELYPLWHVLDGYLVEVKQLTRKVRKDYIGYSLPSGSSMLITISPKKIPINIRVASDAAKLRGAKELCTNGPNTPLGKFDISLTPESKLGDIINVFDSLQDGRS